MKATGIVRKLDELGRLVIPKGIRDTYGWENGASIEIWLDEQGNVVLRKYRPQCRNPVEELLEEARSILPALDGAARMHLEQAVPGVSAAVRHG